MGTIPRAVAPDPSGDTTKWIKADGAAAAHIGTRARGNARLNSDDLIRELPATSMTLEAWERANGEANPVTSDCWWLAAHPDLLQAYADKASQRQTEGREQPAA